MDDRETHHKASGMRPSQKLGLIDKIARALQDKFTYSGINVFLHEYGIAPPQGW